MHESGFMESLDNKWILTRDKDCDAKTEHFPYTLGMKNMAGVFILVFSGIVVAFGLIVIEIIYKKRRARKLKRLAVAKKLAIKWRLRAQVCERKQWSKDCHRSSGFSLFLSLTEEEVVVYKPLLCLSGSFGWHVVQQTSRFESIDPLWAALLSDSAASSTARGFPEMPHLLLFLWSHTLWLSTNEVGSTENLRIQAEKISRLLLNLVTARPKFNLVWGDCRLWFRARPNHYRRSPLDQQKVNALTVGQCKRLGTKCRIGCSMALSVINSPLVMSFTFNMFDNNIGCDENKSHFNWFKVHFQKI